MSLSSTTYLFNLSLSLSLSLYQNISLSLSLTSITQSPPSFHYLSKLLSLSLYLTTFLYLNQTLSLSFLSLLSFTISLLSLSLPVCHSLATIPSSSLSLSSLSQSLSMPLILHFSLSLSLSLNIFRPSHCRKPRKSISFILGEKVFNLLVVSFLIMILFVICLAHQMAQIVWRNKLYLGAEKCFIELAQSCGTQA